MDRIAFRVAVAAVAMMTSALIIAATVVLLAVLSYVALKDVHSASVAVLLPAVGLFAAAVGIFYGGMAIGRRQFRSLVPSSSVVGEKALAEGVGRLVGSGIVEAIQANPRISIAAALVAGLAFGSTPDLRDTLRRML
jgi:hypothetical protein